MLVKHDDSKAALELLHMGSNLATAIYIYCILLHGICAIIDICLELML